MEARVTALSQVDVLRKRLKEASIRHGDEVRADIPGVRVVALRGGPATVFFCWVGKILVKDVLTRGDDKALPSMVVVEGLNFQSSGLYAILDARILANGNIRIAGDERTAVRRLAEIRPPSPGTLCLTGLGLLADELLNVRSMEPEQEHRRDHWDDKEPRDISDVPEMEFFDPFPIRQGCTWRDREAEPRRVRCVRDWSM